MAPLFLSLLTWHLGLKHCFSLSFKVKLETKDSVESVTNWRGLYSQSDIWILSRTCDANQSWSMGRKVRVLIANLYVQLLRFPFQMHCYPKLITCSNLCLVLNQYYHINYRCIYSAHLGCLRAFAALVPMMIHYPNANTDVYWNIKARAVHN